jgi:hypothetical protein
VPLDLGIEELVDRIEIAAGKGRVEIEQPLDVLLSYSAAISHQ